MNIDELLREVKLLIDTVLLAIQTHTTKIDSDLATVNKRIDDLRLSVDSWPVTLEKVLQNRLKPIEEKVLAIEYARGIFPPKSKTVSEEPYPSSEPKAPYG